MPEPLVCEGPELSRLLDEVHSRPGARVLYQDTVRRGGVLGFFAREVHRIAYDLPAPISPDLPDEPGAVAAPQVADGGAELMLEDLLARTDAVESAANAGAETPVPDFAELLRRLTDPPQLPFESQSGEPVAVPERPASVPAEPAMALVTPLGRPDARARLEMLMQLRQIGVPVSVNPRGEAHSLHQALEEILQELPAAPSPPRQAGDVLAIVGESTAAVRAARTCADQLRIPLDRIGIAGLPRESAAGLGHCYISGVGEAAWLRAELGVADTPSVVVIATDATTSDPGDPWARELLGALRPTAAWAVVDARWKTEDARVYLERIGGADALVVHAAELSTSPASVWDLDLPLALLDGRAATTFAWAGLLFRLLATEARHRASA
ncbi:MAG: hypothetical protein ACR2N4_01140 [Jatrophihabitans sp.]